MAKIYSLHPKFGMDGVVLKNGRKINAKGAFLLLQMLMLHNTKF